MNEAKIKHLRDLATARIPLAQRNRDAQNSLDWRGVTRALSDTAAAILRDGRTGVIEKQAAELLQITFMHPLTHWTAGYAWNPATDAEQIAQDQRAVETAKAQQPMIEAAMLEAARLLCELTGEPLPPWVDAIADEPENEHSPDDAKPEATGESEAKAQRGITKGAVINAFEGVYFSRDKWSKYLGDPPDWLKECRVARGSKKASATWNPVLIAAALSDKPGVAGRKLDAAFIRLKDWADEWREVSASFRE